MSVKGTPLYNAMFAKFARLSPRQRTALANKNFKYKMKYPMRIERKYKRELTDLFKDLTRQVTAYIKPRYVGWKNEFKADSFEDDTESLQDFIRRWELKVFGEEDADRQAFLQEIADETNIFNRTQVDRKIQPYVDGYPFVSENWLKPTVEAWKRENLQLMKNELLSMFHRSIIS